ncbi:hypothetical protein BC939DRAFT_454438 [Gamsiella multidivaricata]|uniref:uncharacterized protein n=1 Tax=Gamsiella multidivaricata TaxID=101098 RepID=UPI00221EB5FE|nr:uncharacterized protein BC939DRAFT_454438 [Gamsiella multidivaricata]KAI7821991.1 hypothetical protein BC939DRAFT_454438 [Gamsiella multidivaricata]
MLDSDSGSSDLSEASSPYSDNSSGSEGDVLDRLPQSAGQRLKLQQQHQRSRPSKQGKPQHSTQSLSSIQGGPIERDTRASSLSSSSGSDSDDSTDSDDGDTPDHIKVSKDIGAPISLSASQPIYSKEIMEKSMMHSPANAKYNAHPNTSNSGRGRGRGRGRAPMAGHGSRKYDAQGTMVIDFENPSVSIEDGTEKQHPIPAVAAETASIPRVSPTPSTAHKKKKTTTGRSKTKASKPVGGTNGKQKAGGRKIGRPKSVSKDVYCICRGPYDGIEFMIACDRCEEWFHGRCIGMKPQEAKKSSHYYCDTCQRIRKMFGVADATENSAKLTKTKSKISTDKRAEKDESGTKEKQPTLKIKARLDPERSSASLTGTDHHVSYTSTSYPQPIQQPSRIQSTPYSPATVGQSHFGKGLCGAVNASQNNRNFQSALYDTHSVTAAHTATTPPQHYDSSSSDRTPTFIRATPSAIPDDDEEDVCPVCDFECTCNSNSNKTDTETVSSVSKPAPTTDDPHSYTAVKVPFQPDPRFQVPEARLNSELVNVASHSSFLDARKTPVVKAEDVGTKNNSFPTSLRNPVSTSRRQGGSSAMGRGGKGVGKAPHLMHAVKGYSRGKSMKGGKAAMHMYHQTRRDSRSDISDGFSDNEELEEAALDHGESQFVRRRARYESDSDDIDDMDETLSLSSSSSLSDLDEDAAQATASLSVTDRLTSNPSTPIRLTAGKGWSQPASRKSDQLVTLKKRGPGRPRKQKNPPLIVSREDEMALYTPAVATRKLTATYNPSTKVRAKAELPLIAYDPEVAEDVMTLNAIDSGDESEDHATPIMPAPSDVYSEDDIFGDGDLSDELSGDLSDILSEDLDDLSDDGLNFSSTDEEDEVNSSSSPHEFHYSDMEEQDESLVDSDSSINSITTDSSDSSSSATDSENELYPHDMLDLDDEVDLLEREGSEELIDEEGLMRLEEQERLFLAKAHGLLDVLSEEDSDPGRNPFESSEDEEDEEEDIFGGDEDIYSDEYYEGEYYYDDDDDDYDDYDEVDEQDILNQLKGVQADMQALLMIPPEQQEQLLLLQHYEETHRQQQELQMQHQQQQQHPSQEQIQTSQDLQIAGMLTGSDLLPPLDVNVPDLDAVSEQLAASLASSIAESMAGSMAAKQSLDGSLFSSVGSGENASPTDIPDTNSAVRAPSDVSPKSAPSVSPESSAVMWTASLTSTPTPSDSNSASIPTPANTPTLPGNIMGASPSLPSTTGADTQNFQTPAQTSGPNNHQHTSLLSIQSGGSSQRMQGKVQMLSNNPSYKPLTSIVSVPTIGGRPVQPILPRLAPGESLAGLSPFAKAHAAESQLAMLNQSRLQSSGANAFKEAAQKALGGIISNSKAAPAALDSSRAAPRGDGQASGDTVADASPGMHSTEIRKRKGDDQKTKEIVLHQGKRRRLSTANIMGSSQASAVSEVRSLLNSGTAPTSETESTLPSSSVNSLTISSISTAPSTASQSPLSVVIASIENSSASELTTSVYDFSKGALPFIDPTTRNIGPSGTHYTIRTSKHYLKGKEPKQIDVMPMDDLLDTSALYGRSSSRSPSPDRADAEEGDTEISQTILKDLNRWERVPIGTFRRSRRPSSPYVGLQGALKFGNVTMPATLLSDHQQHQHQQQQQLFQESHRLQRKVPGVRKHRASSSASDILSGLTRRDGSTRMKGVGVSPGVQDRLLQSKAHAALAGSLTDSLLAASVPSTGNVLATNRDPLRRRRRAGSSAAHIHRSSLQAGLSRVSSTQQTSDMAGSGLNMDFHAGLGIGLEGFGGSGISSSKNGRNSGDASRMASLADLRDLMTDSTQLPSSACPTPLHSPLFSATSASGRVHHHNSGEPMVSGDQDGKANDLGREDGQRGEEAIVSHLELDIGKEMDGFHESLMAQSKTHSGKK